MTLQDIRLAPFEKLKKLEGGDPIIQASHHEDVSISLQPDSTVSKGNFKKHSILLNTYLAHPVTIRAVRKEIFAHADQIELLAFPYKCESCHTELDLQFWEFCPYCEKSFPDEVLKKLSRF